MLLTAHKTAHRLGYHGPQSSNGEHVLSLKKDNKDALDHCVEGLVQVLHVEGERVVDEGDVQLRDLRLPCLVALGVSVNRDLCRCTDILGVFLSDPSPIIGYACHSLTP